MSDPKASLFSYKTLVHALAGATGSAVAMGLTYPLDTVRTRLQLDEGLCSDGTMTLLARLIRTEGVDTLYRGAVPVLQSLFCSNFIYFYTFHGLKRLVIGGEHSALKDLVMAMTAGCANVLITNPLWVANTRLKMSGVAVLRLTSSDVSYPADEAGGDAVRRCRCHPLEQPQGQSEVSPSQCSDKQRGQPGLTGLMCQVASREGVGALYNGVTPSLMLTSNPAVHFVAYEAAKRYLQRLYPGVPLGSSTVFLVGAACKALATVITYPLQMVQAKLRVGGLVRENGSRELSVVKILSLLFKRGGLSGVYKGLEAKLLQTMFTTALMFVLYEKIVRLVFSILLGRRR